MKKFSFAFILLYFGLTLAINAQEVTINYKVQYKYTHHSNLDAIKTSQSESLYLLIGENQSVFVNYNVANAEEIARITNEQIAKGNFNSDDWGTRPSNFKSQYYKDFSKQELWILPDLEDYTYAYQEHRVPLKWKILEGDEEEFMGFKVQAARTKYAGRTYTAWFTNEIPIPDGPHVFYGLPGLIVDVYDTEEHFRFQLEGIEKVSEPIKLPNYEKLSFSDFKKIKDKADRMTEQSALNLIRQGAVEYTDQAGVTRALTEKEYLFNQRKEKEAKRKSHNPMELED